MCGQLLEGPLGHPLSPRGRPVPSPNPPGSADGCGLSFSLGPLKYGLHGLLSELGLFFVEAGWARLPKGLLMTRPAPWAPSPSSLGHRFLQEVEIWPRRPS